MWSKKKIKLVDEHKQGESGGGGGSEKAGEKRLRKVVVYGKREIRRNGKG